MRDMRSAREFRPGPSSKVDRVYYSSPSRSQSVAPIGVLMLDYCYSPQSRGNAGNDSGFEVPAHCRVVEGCTVDRLIYEGDDGLEEPIVAAARELVDDGARAIVSNCGFMIRHQAAVSSAVDVPVLLSSLLLVPLLLACIGSRSKLGIVTASGASLTDTLLRRSGIKDTRRVMVGDVGTQPTFRKVVMERTDDFDISTLEKLERKIEQETVNVAGELVANHADIAALLLECTGFSPYAAAVQRSVALPVFDVVSLIDLFMTGFAPPAIQRLVVDGMGAGLALSARS